MIEVNIKVKNKLGIHARPAALFVKTASKFASKIEVEKDDLIVDGKSIMGIMMLAAEGGCNLLIRANGNDEREAIEKISELFEVNFYEE